MDENECKIKYCPGCNGFKSTREFSKDKTRGDGLNQYCSKCRKEKRIWYVECLSGAKARSKKCNYPFDLTKEFLIDLFNKQNGLCYWYDIPMVPSATPKDPQQPTIDRIDPNQGYTQSNVVLACYAANMGRNTTSKERFREFAEMLKGNTNKI